MMNPLLFLQNAVDANDYLTGTGTYSKLIALFIGLALVFFIIFIGLYIYSSLAYYMIAKKARLKTPGLAWIPVVGPPIIAYQASKMDWWPWLLLIGILIPFVRMFAILAFAVFLVIWRWKMFEAIKRPGWFALLCLIPIVNLIIIGIVAWSKK